jgi:hypothetical protein
MVRALDAAGIPYMVAGSFASTFHGIPRTTQDIDMIIEPSGSKLKVFVAALPPKEYYVSEDAALDALRHQSQFNVIDMATGWKADLIVRKSRPFSAEEFRRRVSARLLGLEVFVATPEDTILAKLEWAAMSGSERQLRDVGGVIDVKRGELDLAYIERWAGELGVADLWRKVSASTSPHG